MNGRAPLLAWLTAIISVAATPSRSEELRDLYYGEALYFAYQGQFFEALERLDTEVKLHDGVDEPELDSLYHHIDSAEFSLGDFELRYRMHHRAGRAIRAVLEGAVDELVRNDAAFRLARIHFQKGQMEDSLRALERIDGKVPVTIRDDIEFLRANVYLAQDNPQAAVGLLKDLQGSEGFGGLAAYNLGIAYLQQGQSEQAMAQLDRAGQFTGEQPVQLAIRDKANLVLGTMLLEGGDYQNAARFFNRVRVGGPFSNQALLSSGWANLSAKRFDRAVVPWSILSKRNVTDFSTQEALLALPYAYGKLDVHGRAAVLYGEALDVFGAEIKKLNESVHSIREGKFLEVLIREEIRKDKDWVIRLRSLPETPETYYLMDLMASHDFQTGLQNYLDLADLRKKLRGWQGNFDAFDDMVDIRREHYEPLLPDVDTEFRELDSRLRLRTEQYKMLVERRDDLLTTPRPEFLATRAEQADLERIEAIEVALSASQSPEPSERNGKISRWAVDESVQDNLQQRLDRLRGLLAFTLATEYHERLAEFDRNLRGLDEAMAVVQTQYDEFVRARQAASHSYTGYETPIKALRTDVRQAIERIERLMARQGRMLEVVAIEVLVARRVRLEDFSDKARFALADSYDRAAQRQARMED